MIEEIVVGSEEDGKVAPYTITFVFKTGLQIKKSDENKGLYSYSADDTRGVHSSDKTRRKPHGIRLCGYLERRFLMGKNDDKNSVIFKMIGFLLL
ncbi:MAG: hypothetical protein GX854_06410 [Clostridiales bacterium]|nr:hypothetical protein [Clostridiales bacterium]